ncbi:MAG: tryptophan--tRNA ligase [Bacteroidota bacterium]
MSDSRRKTVLSCIQPTGDMHLGNYFGAIKNWVDLQEKYDCIYGVVDYHAMTMPYNTNKLRTNTWDLITNLIATGVKPENLFIQSLVPEHTELGWIFNCFCGVGELSRMTQYKDKSQKQEEEKSNKFISVGLLDYPVLQTADILIYKADYVPVGKDQDQHLELSRNIAGRFNHQVGKEYFVMPQGLHTETPKIMSTADPSRKMSKSAGEKHYIAVFGKEARIMKQIKSAVTDTGENTETMSPGVENLFSMLKASGDVENHTQLLDTYKDGNLRYGDLKMAVGEAIVKMTNQFKANRAELLNNKRAMKDQIKQSSIEIRKKAQETLKEVKELVGLVNVKY